jgi:hypothetical protein
MKIFELRQQREEALSSADNCLSVATLANRDLTAAETQLFDGYVSKAKNLEAKIQAITERNTLSSQCGPQGFFGRAAPP